MNEARRDAINSALAEIAALPKTQLADYWDEHMTAKADIKLVTAIWRKLFDQYGLDPTHRCQRTSEFFGDVMKVNQRRATAKRRRDHKAAKAERKAAARRAKKAPG